MFSWAQQISRRDKITKNVTSLNFDRNFVATSTTEKSSSSEGKLAWWMEVTSKTKVEEVINSDHMKNKTEKGIGHFLKPGPTTYHHLSESQ